MCKLFLFEKQAGLDLNNKKSSKTEGQALDVDLGTLKDQYNSSSRDHKRIKSFHCMCKLFLFEKQAGLDLNNKKSAKTEGQALDVDLGTIKDQCNSSSRDHLRVKNFKYIEPGILFVIS